MITLPIDRGLQLYWLSPSSEDTYPTITVTGRTMSVPVFITKETVQEEDPESKTVYKCYRVTMDYCGENINDYVKVLRTRWDDLRKYFYGPDWFQHELTVKGLQIGHQLAVKAIFPKDGQTELPEDMQKFNETYNTFWTLISRTCQAYNIPYNEIPTYFDSSYMLIIASKYGITGDALTQLVMSIQLIVDDLFSNSRRWKELMPRPDESELVGLL